MFVSRVVFGAIFLTVWGRAILGRFIMDENENPGEPSLAALEENVSIVIKIFLNASSVFSKPTPR